MEGLKAWSPSLHWILLSLGACPPQSALRTNLGRTLEKGVESARISAHPSVKGALDGESAGWGLVPASAS